MPVVGPRFTHVHLARPVAVLAPPFPTLPQQTIQVSLATINRPNPASINRRTPRQGQESWLTTMSPLSDGGTPVYPLRRPQLGPKPPTVVTPPPTRRQQTLTAALAVRARRASESRRYPLPGHEGQLVRETGYTTAAPATNASFVQALRKPNLGPKPPVVVGPLPAQQQQTIGLYWHQAVTRVSAGYQRRAPNSKLSPTIIPAAAFVAPPVGVNLAVGLATNSRRAQQRRTLSLLRPPTVVRVSSVEQREQTIASSLARTRPRKTTAFVGPPETLEPQSVQQAERTIRVALARTRPRPTIRLFTAAPYLSPLAVVTTPGQLAVAIHTVRTRTRPFKVALPVVIVAPSGFVASPISVTLQDNRVRGFGRRHFPSLVLNPPTVLQTFAGPQVNLVQVRTRQFAAKYVGLATLEPEAVALAERQIRVVLIKTRPRRTLGTRLAYTVYPATSEIGVAFVKTRPRPTRVAQRGLIFYPVAETALLVQNVRTRPRPTTKFVAPPATLQPYAVILAEDTVRVVLARTRPRHTLGTKLGYAVYPATSEITVSTVRTRPRPTTRRLTAVTYPQTTEITVTLTRTRPRPTRKTVGPAIFYPQTSEIAVAIARTRPRRTTTRLAPPTVLQVFPGPAEVEIAVRTPVEDRRRFPHSKLSPPATLEPESVAIAERQIRTLFIRTRPFRTLRLLTAVTYPATSIVRAVLVRTRPRPTQHLLTAVTYPQTGVGFLHTVRARPRATTRFLAPPSTLQPYAVTIAEDTVRVVLARTRPRRTVGTKLAAPTTLRTFFGPSVSLVRTRPRPTARRILPPTVVRVPSVEQREDTITVALVRIRPRPTTRFLIPPVVKTFPPTVTTLLPAHLVATRPRPTRKFVEPPTIVIPLPTLQMQTVAVALARTRPRSTRYTLGLVVYPQTSAIRVSLALTRPRRTTRFLAPPTTLQTFGPPVEVEIAVRTSVEDRARRRPTSFAIQPVTYPATSEIAVVTVRTRPRPTANRLTAVTYPATSAIAVALAQTRPRRTRRLLGPPTVLQTFAGPATSLVRTRPRQTIFAVAPPATLEPESVELAEREIRVVLARARPRPTIHRLTAVSYPQTGRVAVAVARTRPRPTAHRLAAPSIVARPAFGAVAAKLVRTRPRLARSRLAPPATLEPAAVEQAERTIRVVLARTRPRPIRSRLTPPTVVVVRVRGRVAATLTRSRPRPTGAVLAAPTVVAPQIFGVLAVRVPTTRPRVFTRFRLAPPTVVAPPARAVVVDITVVLVRNRPRPQNASLNPPAVVRKAHGIGQATGYSVATASASGEKVATGSASGEKVATSEATGDAAETSGATGDSQATGEATGDTRP